MGNRHAIHRKREKSKRERKKSKRERERRKPKRGEDTEKCHPCLSRVEFWGTKP